jgi:hypothetical protein
MSYSNLVAELLLIRHPDTYPETNGVTGQPAVSKPNIVLHPDVGLQMVDFFRQANRNALDTYEQYTPDHLRHIDRAFSSPRIRALMAWADILPLVDGVTNNNRRLLSQQEVRWWLEERFAAKLHQEGLSTWQSEVERIKQRKEPWAVYTAIVTIEEEIRREQFGMLAGIKVDDRLRDISGSEVAHAGMNRKAYEQLINEREITAANWFGLHNFLGQAMVPSGRQRDLARPMRAVAITHGTNVVVAETLLRNGGREETAVGRTYAQIKSAYGSIPHGSGLQVFKYGDGRTEVNRIYTSTHVVRERGVQPPEPTYLDAATINDFWRN